VAGGVTTLTLCYSLAGHFQPIRAVSIYS